MNTELVYMTDNTLLEYSATVVEMSEGDIVLASTIFYPQGGGQPYDQGTIQGKNGRFEVKEVRNVDGIVHHLGALEGKIMTGEEIICQVNKERRILNTRTHSAGHVLDMAVHQAGFKWIPGKGHQFPEGPYVEYSGNFEGLDITQAKEAIESECAKLIAQDLPVRIEFMNREEMQRRLAFVPEYLPTNRPSRVVFIGEVGIPCGGTHVQSLKEIRQINVRKIKVSGGVLKISYQISQEDESPNIFP